MRQVLLVGHGTFAQGLLGAIEMLMGEREWLGAASMGPDTTPEAFAADVEAALSGLSAGDELVLIADIAGGSPANIALERARERLGEAAVCAFGGANLPMAISALMGVEEGLDLETLACALAEEGAQAVRAL